jgi:PD-(D/E)XK nuclease superfamily
MKRYISGLNQAGACASDGLTDGLFLVRIERIQYRWHRQKPFYAIQFSVVEPIPLAGQRFTARLSCSSKNLWKLNWFLRDFGYDPELLERNEIDDKSLVGLCGVVKITHSVVNGTTLLDLDGFAPASHWRKPSGGTEIPVSQEIAEPTGVAALKSGSKASLVTYSYSQLAHYLSCPRRYRHRYLDGWQEKDSRASMLFGRAFEQALGAYFRREDAAVAFYREWATYQKQPLHYGERDSWDRMLEQALMLLDRFSQDDRVRVAQPRKNLQIKFVRPLASGNDFVAYVDAIGKLDGTGCLLEWKTTSSRYPEQPDGLLALDPQLLCYSWISGISEVAQVVFVRKRLVEIQYLHTRITDEQRHEFSDLVQETIRQIESAQFLPHSGIRFPQNPCSTCPYLGLCLGKPALIEAALIRRPGAQDFGVFDELTY